MCGLIGIISYKSVDEKVVGGLHQLQQHRGPDAVGEFRDRCGDFYITFLHQRLSIIDLVGGLQPMTEESGRYTIIFNGEIFNFKELKKGLSEKGYSFKTDRSDTEVLLKMYMEYREEMLAKLNGMFAFAIYDKQEGEVFIARDQCGIKPLYYMCNNHGFYFASELKSLLQLDVPKEIDPQSLSNYLSFQFIPSERSIIKGIKKLPVAKFIKYKVQSRKIITEKYWEIGAIPERNWKIDDVCVAVKEQLYESVNRWALSDVSVGASLSGGIDSSLTVALYSKLAKSRIKTFTLGFDGDCSDLDERELARFVSKKYNTEHHEFVINSQELINELDDMVYHLDEPYAGGLPSWYVYKMMKGKVKVALTGSGGDELFGNYNKAFIYKSSILRKLKRVFHLSNKDFLGAVKYFLKYPQGFFYHKYFGGHSIDSILKDEYKNERIPPEAVIEKLIHESNTQDASRFVPYIDFKMQLPEEFLHVTDRFSMSHSIEARVPFLDPEMIRLVMSIPPSLRSKFSDRKYVLKKTFAEELPQEIINAPKKGFVIPEKKWIRNHLKEQVEYLLGKQYLIEQGIFNPKLYDMFVEPHMKGSNYHWQIWTLFMFQKWYETFIK